MSFLVPSPLQSSRPAPAWGAPQLRSAVVMGIGAEKTLVENQQTGATVESRCVASPGEGAVLIATTGGKTSRAGLMAGGECVNMPAESWQGAAPGEGVKGSRKPETGGLIVILAPKTAGGELAGIGATAGESRGAGARPDGGEALRRAQIAVGGESRFGSIVIDQQELLGVEVTINHHNFTMGSHHGEAEKSQQNAGNGDLVTSGDFVFNPTREAGAGAGAGVYAPAHAPTPLVNHQKSPSHHESHHCGMIEGDSAVIGDSVSLTRTHGVCVGVCVGAGAPGEIGSHQSPPSHPDGEETTISHQEATSGSHHCKAQKPQQNAGFGGLVALGGFLFNPNAYAGAGACAGLCAYTRGGEPSHRKPPSHQEAKAA